VNLGAGVKRTSHWCVQASDEGEPTVSRRCSEEVRESKCVPEWYSGSLECGTDYCNAEGNVILRHLAVRQWLPLTTLRCWSPSLQFYCVAWTRCDVNSNSVITCNKLHGSHYILVLKFKDFSRTFKDSEVAFSMTNSQQKFTAWTVLKQHVHVHVNVISVTVITGQF